MIYNTQAQSKLDSLSLKTARQAANLYFLSQPWTGPCSKEIKEELKALVIAAVKVDWGNADVTFEKDKVIIDSFYFGKKELTRVFDA